ncbi:hypothetical protein KRMM14A1004_18050 [Krasilnikovia sp. MM14-A1004]
MDAERATRIVETLQTRNVFAHVKLPHAGLTRHGVRVVLPGGREAIWDTDGTAGLEAQVMRDGMLVGFVPSIPGSENFGDAQIVEAIATADYDRAGATSRPATPRDRVAAAPRPGAVSAAPSPLSLAARLRRTFRD